MSHPKYLPIPANEERVVQVAQANGRDEDKARNFLAEQSETLAQLVVNTCPVAGKKLASLRARFTAMAKEISEIVESGTARVNEARGRLIHRSACLRDLRKLEGELESVETALASPEISKLTDTAFAQLVVRQKRLPLAIQQAREKFEQADASAREALAEDVSTAVLVAQIKAENDPDHREMIRAGYLDEGLNLESN
jgi:hypothetical protein